jgi:hypothetical protein
LGSSEAYLAVSDGFHLALPRLRFQCFRRRIPERGSAVHHVSSSRSKPRPWWEAPALDATPAQARDTAYRLLTNGSSFNRYQRRFLCLVANNNRPLTPFRKRVMGMLMALARQGGWKWIDA